MSWTNEKPLNLRTRIALKLIIIAVKIIEPYQFQHEFEKDWKELETIINQDPKGGKDGNKK